MSQQPKISKGTRVVVKGPNARFAFWARGGVSHDAGEREVCADGWQPQPTVFAAFFFAIAEGGVG